jgi:peptidoglycan/xylan/chitin deacetylase (PgdA/CDA1 family)
MRYRGSTRAHSLLILTLVFSLISAGILDANITISIDAYAKKVSKKISDRNSNGGNSRTRSTDKGSSLNREDDDTPFKKDNNKLTEPNVPVSLTLKIPANGKFVIINFDDSHESDYTYAKPILDKYGFEATFFEVCDWIEEGHHDNDISITWQKIATLQQDGMDIEAHTMTHSNLNDLSKADLDYEIGQSKQCLKDHGINPTIFAYPNGKGSDNPKVVNTVAKYNDLSRTDSKLSALTFLHCDGGSDIGNNEQQQQTDCRTHFSDGTLTPSNRYSINSWAHKHIEEGCSVNRADNGDAGNCKSVRHEYNNSQMF